MREIKFRAWDKIEGKMWNPTIRPDGLLMASNQIGGWVTYQSPSDPLMQYTGLKDKSGIEIYEGDIVTAKTNKNPTLDLLGKVFFEDGEYLIEQEQYDFPLCSFAVIDRLSFEVIGDIYQNPELLEKDDGE